MIKVIQTSDDKDAAIRFVRQRNMDAFADIVRRRIPPSKFVRYGLMYVQDWNQHYPDRVLKTANRYVIYEEDA